MKGKKYPTTGILLILCCASLYILSIFYSDLKSNKFELPTKEFIFYNHRAYKRYDINGNYILNNPYHCNISSVFLMQLITSHVGNFELRQLIRQEYNYTELGRLGIKRLFLLAKIPSKSANTGGKFRIPTYSEILRENEISHDVIVGDFEENYRNLTLKHLMGLYWVNEHCAHAHFVLKQDDDIFTDLYGIVEKLKNTQLGMEIEKDDGKIYGKLLKSHKVIRNPISKWYVTSEEYAHDKYSDFVSGWAYITTPLVIKKILEEEKKFKRFWIDDVHITGTLRSSANVQLVDGSSTFAVKREFFSCCKTVTAKAYRGNISHWCDFLFGPAPFPDMRSELIKKSTYCYISRDCVHRNVKEFLLASCIITRNPRDESAISASHLKQRKKGIPLQPIRL